MENFAERHDRNCCTMAEELAERMIAMDPSRLDLAYRRLSELTERARRRRAALNRVHECRTTSADGRTELAEDAS